MSNLVNESGLANGIAAQIFGKFSDSGLHSTAVPSSGVYRVARTIQYGPHALYDLLNRRWLSGSDAAIYSVGSSRNGSDRLSYPYTEFLRVGTLEVMFTAVNVLGFLTGLLWALGMLLFFLYKLLTRKGLKKGQGLQIMAGLLQWASAVNLAVLFLNALSFRLPPTYRWQLVLFLALLMIMAGLLAMMLWRWMKLRKSGQKTKGLLTSAAFLTFGGIFILFAQVYQFWAV